MGVRNQDGGCHGFWEGVARRRVLRREKWEIGMRARVVADGRFDIVDVRVRVQFAERGCIKRQCLSTAFVNSCRVY